MGPKRRPLAAGRKSQLPLVVAAVLVCLAAQAWAWKPPVDREGPLTVTIGEFGDVNKLGEPIPVTVTIANAAQAAVSGSVRIGLVDDWRVEGADQQAFTAPAEGEMELVFAVVPGTGSFAAHYPVHAYVDFEAGGLKLQAHAVYVTQVLSKALGVATRNPGGFGSLTALRTEQSVEVDGELDEWDRAITVPLGAAQRSTGQFQPGDFGALLRMLHRSGVLYLALAVTDDDISGDDATTHDFMNSEYLRIYASATPPGKRSGDGLTEDDLVVAISPLATGGPKLRVPAYGMATRALPEPERIKVAARKSPTGYSVEVALPLDLVGEAIGKTMGLNLMLGDADAGRREAEVTIGNQIPNYWMSPQSYVTLELSEQTEDDGRVSLPVTPIAGPGALALDRLGTYRVTVAREGQPTKELPIGWTGSDAETGTGFSPGSVSRPDAKPSIIIHPPYRQGVGRMWAETRLALPDITPIKLTFHTAIRSTSAPEPPSDGVEWRVQVVSEGQVAELFKRFSAAKTWEPAEVDLTAYAGKTLTLRLWNGPGPNNNTLCDSGYWGEPTIVAGREIEPRTEEQIEEQRQRALMRARAALQGRQGKFFWRVENAAGVFGVGWAAGPYAFAEGTLAFVSADAEVVFDGFHMAINGHDVTDWRSNLSVLDGKAGWNPDKRAVTLMDFVRDREGETITVWASMYEEDGAFKIEFSMPTEERNSRGEPRFTRLGLGPATVKAKRVYAGFGNVIEHPQRFTLGQGGFTLSARHVGVDFENGLSMVQASDVFPYEFVVDPDKNLYSLRTGHDATMMFIPSSRGAFAAARVYRDLSGFAPSSGVEKLKGKMCIDWWGHHEIADEIRRAGAYGLNDSVFLKHAWQRHGYDYRLPDIYPPSCDPQVWMGWINAAKDAGMLVAVHDNYIDFYPDASDFSYRHILFNGDGTPQRAWFHKGYKAQSYRWRPGAYNPWLERNIELIKEGFAPTAYFIDVFSAIPLLDYYDIDGNFHTKMECGKHWGETFDYVREQLGNDAPQICEAGHDGLIGHLDGAQSDHNSAEAWGWKCADADRTPWHDMASHGSMILFAGGLGSRYAGGDPHADWGSDDYLSNTMMGGRNPMCVGPCARSTVMTYWLQHDICDALARQSFESHEFVGDDIHRQHTTFGDGGEVWVNRGQEPWEIEGVTLPKFGYLAKSGDVISQIVEEDGLPVGYASSPGVTFVDARPDALDLAGRAAIKTRVVEARVLEGGQVEVDVEFDVIKPITAGWHTFVHVQHDEETRQAEKIAIHPSLDMPAERLQKTGLHRATARFSLAEAPWDGEYRFGYGLYSPGSGGGRLPMIAPMEGGRVLGGSFMVERQDGKIASVEYRPYAPPTDGPRTNTEGKMIDFGGIATNGAFRLLHEGAEWTLLPLQGSLRFQAELRIEELGSGGKWVASVTGLTQTGEDLGQVAFNLDEGTLELDLDAEAFSYRIGFE